MNIRDGLNYYTLGQDRQFPGQVVVHGWGTYPRNSVLAGQPRKVFLDVLPDEEAAREYIKGLAGARKAREANWSGRWTEPQVNLNHLPGDDDPDPYGDNRAEHDSVANDWRDWA